MAFNLTTFVFEIVNFLALVGILYLVAYRPLRRAIRRRADAMAEREAEVARRLTETEALGHELEARRAKLDQIAAEVRRTAVEEAADERARILAGARADAEAERARARRLVEADRQAAQAWVREAAIDEGVGVAGQMLMALAPETVHERLVALLLDELARDGAGLAAAGGEPGAEPIPEVELTFARTPERDEVERLREALGQALAGRPHLEVHEDEDLLAGVVVRVGAQVLDASVAGQLTAFAERARQLAYGEAHPTAPVAAGGAPGDA